MGQPPRKLLERVRETIQRMHYSIRTETAYVNWIKRYILFPKVKQGFARKQIVVREGKGEKDRVTVVPESLVSPLRRISRITASLSATNWSPSWHRTTSR